MKISQVICQLCEKSSFHTTRGNNTFQRRMVSCSVYLVFVLSQFWNTTLQFSGISAGSLKTHVLYMNHTNFPNQQPREEAEGAKFRCLHTLLTG